MNCIRRPHALWTSCRCAKCKPHHRRLLKLHQAGLLDRGNPDHAVALIKTWRAQGYSILWIATAARVDKAWVLTVAKGTITRPGPILTRRILAADIRKATAGLCPAIGSARRLQALAVMGWDIYTISERYDIPPAVLSRIRSGNAGEVRAERYAAIRTAFEELSMQRGPSAQGTTRARTKGWAPPLAWDDGTIDDPATQPDLGTGARRLSNQRIDVDDIAWFLDVEPMATAQRIGERFGVTKDAVQMCARRAERRDLLARLARNAEVAA